ncbi:MAG: flagellum-specific ATP synthase FliI, partial [Bryobacteraceae bacterium]
KQAAVKIREALSTYQRAEDLINLGAYAAGANPKLDSAIRLRAPLMEFLKQDAAQNAPLEETMTRLRELSQQV